jgi:hypothetical protein
MAQLQEGPLLVVLRRSLHCSAEMSERAKNRHEYSGKNIEEDITICALPYSLQNWLTGDVATNPRMSTHVRALHRTKKARAP